MLSTVADPAAIVKRTAPCRSCQLPSDWLKPENGGGELSVPEAMGGSAVLFSNISYWSTDPGCQLKLLTANCNEPCGWAVKADTTPVKDSVLN